jgi:hypothetical protein
MAMKKVMGWGIALVSLICMGYLGFAWVKYIDRPVVHLIPEGTKGWCHAVWDDPNASPLIETKDERIIYFNNKCIAHTSASSDENYTVEYYYVDKDGKRTELIYATLQILQEGNTNYPETTIFLYGGGLRGIDEGPDGPFYPGVSQFFLGTYDEIQKERLRIEKEEKDNFPPYPEDALKLKRDKK